jgi:hypothetical protein
MATVMGPALDRCYSESVFISWLNPATVSSIRIRANCAAGPLPKLRPAIERPAGVHLHLHGVSAEDAAAPAG